MNEVITVVFDGEVLRPENPLNLEPNQRYIITITNDQETQENQDGWDAIAALAGIVDAPVDWSIEHDHYLYGTPKRYSNEPEQ